MPDPLTERRRKRVILRGDVPSPVNPPSGCRFHTRCWLYERLGKPENCRTDDPPLRVLQGDHRAACHYAEEALKTDVGIAHVVDTSGPPRNAAVGAQGCRQGKPEAAHSMAPLTEGEADLAPIDQSTAEARRRPETADATRAGTPHAAGRDQQTQLRAAIGPLAALQEPIAS